MALATLSVDFVARLAEFKRGLDEAGRLTDARTRSMAAAFDKIRGSGLAIGGALTAAFGAGGAVLAFVQRLNAPLLAMKDLSEATGATIENVSALENVARTAGASFSVVEGALIKFNQSLAAADKPTAAVSEALRRLGLDAEELKRLDPALALRSVAQALAGFADDGEKARLVQELFGRSVKETVPFLKELADQQQFAATVTAEQVEAADRLSKELAALSKSAEDAGRSIAARLVPAINRFFEELRVGREAYGDNPLAALFDIGLNVNPLQSLEANLAGTREAIEATEASLRRFQGTTLRNPLGFSGVVERGLQLDLERLRARERYLTSIIGQRSGAPPGVATNLPGLPPPATPAAGPARAAGAAAVAGLPMGPELDRLRESVLALTSQTTTARLAALREQLAETVALRASSGDESYDEVLRTLVQRLTALDPAAQAAAERMERLNDLLRDTPSARMLEASEAARMLFDELGTATDPQRIEQINQALDAMRERLGLLPEAAQDVASGMSAFAEQASRNIQDALGDTLERVLQGNFRNIGQLWLQTLQRMAAQAAAAKLNQYLFGPGGAGGAGGGLLAGLSSIFSPRADGGPAQPGESYLVGERGPELITMGSIGGYVQRAERLRGRGALGGGSGVTVVQNVEVTGDVGPATVALVERMLGRERARAARQAYAMGAS